MRVSLTASSLPSELKSTGNLREVFLRETAQNDHQLFKLSYEISPTVLWDPLDVEALGSPSVASLALNKGFTADS